jgi:tRNA A-37 threonylcarbamoyl transferase component Bud32
VKKRHISNPKAPTRFDQNCTRAKITAEVKLLEFARKSGINAPRVLEFSLEEGHIKMEYLQKFTTAERYFVDKQRDEQECKAESSKGKTSSTAWDR